MKTPQSAAIPVDRDKQRLIDELKRERETNRVKGLFVNMVSHEMRTPLAVIQGTIDLIEHCGERLSSAEKISYIQAIKKSILRMTRTMDTILLLGKVQNNQLSFQPLQVDVVKLCKNIANEIENLNDGRKIVFKISKSFPRELDIDTTLLYHIVSNLLSNAIKYSDPKKMVYLMLSYEQQSLVIRVKDFGVGIPRNEVKTIFKLFHR
jgi:signal transduction histidine kinase